MIVANADGRHQQQHDGFDGPHSEPLHRQQQQHIHARDDDSPKNGDMKQHEQRHRAAQDFSQIARDDRQFRHEPVRHPRPLGIPIVAALGQVAPGRYAEPRGDNLQEDRHQAGQTDDPKQSVFELGAALQISSPVARIHVGHADQNRRAEVGGHLLPEACFMMGHFYAVMQSFQRHGTGTLNYVAGHRPIHFLGDRFHRFIWIQIHKTKINSARSFRPTDANYPLPASRRCKRRCRKSDSC